MTAHAIQPITHPWWERIYELHALDLAAAEPYVMGGRPQLAKPFFQHILHALGQEGNLAGLETEYRAAYQQNPKNVTAINVLAAVALLQGEWEKAAAWWKKSLAVATNQPDILYNLGCINAACWKLEEAIAAFSYLLQLLPQHPEASVRLARCYTHLGRMEEASGVLDELLATVPVFAEALSVRIACAKSLGDTETAARLCRQAYTMFPEHTEFFATLTEAEALTPEDPLVLQAAQQEADDTTPLRDQVMLGFALYRVYERAGRESEAFAYLEGANQRQHLHMEWDASAVAAQSATIKAFTPVSHAYAPVTRQIDVAPIFLVGMTDAESLAHIERVLARHPQVHGAGELGYLSRLAAGELAKVCGLPYPHAMPRLAEMDAATIASLREFYLSRLRAHDGSAQYIVDRGPEHFYAVGLIRALFPEAKIIHCVREPVAACFSLYRQHHPHPQPYGYDKAALAVMWKEYHRLMQHWQEVHAEAIYTLRYEALLTQPEQELRALLAYCGVPWNDACLQEERQAPVRGAKAAPAASPHPADTAWRRYEKELEGLQRLLVE